MAVLKHSRQREAIYNNLQHRKDHPTADMIFADIRKESQRGISGKTLLVLHRRLVRYAVRHRALRWGMTLESGRLQRKLLVLRPA